MLLCQFCFYSMRPNAKISRRQGFREKIFVPVRRRRACARRRLLLHKLGKLFLKRFHAFLRRNGKLGKQDLFGGGKQPAFS